MFKPVPMRRLNAVVLERDERLVLRELGNLGAVELVRTPAGDTTAPRSPPDHAAALARCDRLRARLAGLRPLLGLQAGTAPVSPPVLTSAQAEETLTDLEAQAQALTARRAEGRRRLQELETRAGPVGNLEGLGVPLNALAQFEFLHFVTGTLPEGAWTQPELREAAVLLALRKSEERQPVVAVTTRTRAAALDGALRRAGFQAESVPAAESATPEAWLARAQRERERLLAQDTELQQALASLGLRCAAVLEGLEAWIELERRLLEASQSCPRTESAVLITGWIPEPSIEAVRQRLLVCTDGRCAFETTPPGGEGEAEIPTLLCSPRFLRPFELLVTAYGLPKYRELAPTLFVALSYVWMFGMMFGDVGHGGLLVLGSGVLWWSSRTRPRRDLGVLLGFNGLSSMLFGAVYGSYFGLPQLKGYALWHDPLEGDPIVLMGLALGVGVVLMSTGLVLNIVNRSRQRDWWNGLLGRFGVMGVLFYWGALVLLAQAGAIRAQGWWVPALAVLLGLPMACWALEAPLRLWLERGRADPAAGEGLAAAVTESFVGAFESVLLYLANTVSFVRLAAYAMSHAALLMATFSLAAEVGRLGGAGPVLAVLVVVAGNLVAVLLEGIVALVQALRLEYYEFFGKFFSGEGKPFKPFCLTAPSA